MTTHHILLVESDADNSAWLHRTLSDFGELRQADGGSEALRMARETPPDVIVMAIRMPGLTGFQTCAALKNDSLLANVPVVLIADQHDPEIETAGLDIGAADVLTRPLDAAVVVARIKVQLRQKRQADEWRQLLAVDALTGLANRAHLGEVTSREWRRAHRAGEALSLLRIEIDHFGLYRGHHGTAAANRCLQTVAGVLRQAARRPADVVAHLGDEGFALLLPATDRQGAQHLAHRVLDGVEQRAIPHETSPLTNHVTVSIGVACHDRLSECWIGPNADARLLGNARLFRSADDLARAAEIALATARQAGHAQAMMMDVAHVDAEHRVVEVGPESRASRG